MKTYNKLVRDRIPDIIRNNGSKCTIEILDNEEYIEMLDIKLYEELEEYQANKSIEELADLLEVIYAVTAARGSSISELEEIRKKKRDERGGFEDKIFLKEVF